MFSLPSQPRALIKLSLAMPLVLATIAAASAAPDTQVKHHHQGLHGYIGYRTNSPPAGTAFNMGMGFYTAVWPLIDQPLAQFQIGLPGCWILPDNRDNKSTPLAPVGTRAREWKERGPTWDSVFQTVEGGLGYWRGNRFRYGAPKFSLNATPQCYDYEVGSPGWSFFYDTEALADDQLGLAQLSNRLLIPPDALPFKGQPNGEFMGYTYLALPFTDPVPDGDPPTGSHAWTCFINTKNFKGPIAYYVPETWSKVGKRFDYPFLYGRGLDARPGIMHGGAMEINTVPCYEQQTRAGITYSKIPKLQFPVDRLGRSLLVQQVNYYSKEALYNDFLAWRKGGTPCSGSFAKKGTWNAKISANPTRYSQAKLPLKGIDQLFESHAYSPQVWGIRWNKLTRENRGAFPQYFRHEGDKRVPIDASEVPAELSLREQRFALAKRGQPFTSPKRGAWTHPGPALGPYQVELADGSLVTYSWYRFIDQPTFQQYQWSEQKKARLQHLVEQIHAHWPIDRDYMAPPAEGELVSLDSALIVTPPRGFEYGYVPIVTRQEDAQ